METVQTVFMCAALLLAGGLASVVLVAVAIYATRRNS